MKDQKKYILIADDEREIREVLSLLLSGEGYSVCTCKNGREALEAACEDVDLYLLDINMPEMTGISAAAEIRKKHSAPIVFLTAFSGESDKIKGFSVGADDYIVKPFSSIELLLRIKAILRREKGGSADTQKSKTRLAFGDLILDLDSQCVIREGEKIDLTYTEFKILELLVKNKKKIFSLESIYSSIWDDNAVGDSAIMVHIKNIRKKLSDSSKDPRYIKTAW